MGVANGAEDPEDFQLFRTLQMPRWPFTVVVYPQYAGIIHVLKSIPVHDRIFRCACP